jgi:hypothetical protein
MPVITDAFYGKQPTEVSFIFKRDERRRDVAFYRRQFREDIDPWEDHYWDSTRDERARHFLQYYRRERALDMRQDTLMRQCVEETFDAVAHHEEECAEQAVAMKRRPRPTVRKTVKKDRTPVPFKRDKRSLYD